jgi:hypothetical protein
MIEKLGWDKSSGVNVSGLPTPLPGPGLKQSIQVSFPEWPAHDSSLYIWLRRDQEARESVIKAPPLPAPAIAPTATSITSSAERSVAGQAIALLAKVNPSAATGSVKFMDGPASIGTATLNAGQASLTTSNLAPGSKTIRAVYTGDGNHGGSTSPALTQTVEKRATSATISSTPNPSTFEQPVTFTAVVATTPSDGATPTGTVTFYAGDTVLGTASLDNKGAATLSEPALTTGKYDVKAVYRGFGVFAESSSAPLTHLVQ